MGGVAGHIRRSLPALGSALSPLILVWLLVIAYGSNALSDSTARPTIAPPTQSVLVQATQPSTTPPPIKLLKVEPVKGYRGRFFHGNG